MITRKMDRREILKSCGMGMAALAFPAWQVEEQSASKAEPGVTVIRVGNIYAGGQWYFDPVGLYIPKGTKVRWTSTKWGATVTAFHPSNDNHELRIPENAKPFDSGLIGDSYKNTFEWTFDVEGTYDYFSRNHESLGMVGRIVVGRPGGPAERFPLGYGGREGRAVVFPQQVEAMAVVPSQEIVAKKTIPFPRTLLYRPHPYGDVR